MKWEAIVYNVHVVVFQRHFAVFACSFPTNEAVCAIYSTILVQHLAQSGMTQQLQRFTATLVNGALALHTRVTQSFLPTAIKFHYVFNLRDLSNIFQVTRKVSQLISPFGFYE
jgi:dynein heavy chain